MPYGQSPWEQVIPAMQGIGQSMGNVMMASQQGNLRQRQFLAEQAYRQAQLQMQRQQMAQQAQMNQARIGNLGVSDSSERMKMDVARQSAERSQMMGRLQGFQGSPNPMSMVSDPYNGPQLMNDLRQANVLPQGRMDLTQEQLMQAVKAALQGQTFQQATATPTGAGRMIMNPYQQGSLQENVRHHGVLEDVAQQNADSNLQRSGGRLSVEDLQRKAAMDEYVKATMAQRNLGGQFNMNAGTPQYGQASNLVNQAASKVFGGQPQVPQGEGQPRVVRSREERDALPPGTVYVGPDGIPATKQ